MHVVSIVHMGALFYLVVRKHPFALGARSDPQVLPELPRCCSDGERRTPLETAATLTSAPSRHLLGAVGGSQHPAGVDQCPPTEMALGHGDGQSQRGLQGRLPWVLARCALKAAVDPLDLPVCYLSPPA